MNSQRQMAWDGLERAVRKQEAFDYVLEFHSPFNPLGYGPDLTTLKEIQLDLDYAAARAQERVAKRMKRIYNDFRHWTATGADNKGWQFSYSVDKDGDGWYWWKVVELELIYVKGQHKPLSIWNRLSEEWGKCRKRKDAKAKALAAFEQRQEKLNAKAKAGR